MLAELLYFVSIALFGFVILGAVQLPNDMWLVAGIFPVFIAMILGYMMWVYAWSRVRLAGERRLAGGADRGRACRCAGCRRATCSSRSAPRPCIGLICARLAFLAADLG